MPAKWNIKKGALQFFILQRTLSFKDCIAADIQQVFLNEDEFAGVHTVDGRPMRVILDDDGLQQRMPPGAASTAKASIIPGG